MVDIYHEPQRTGLHTIVEVEAVVKVSFFFETYYIKLKIQSLEKRRLRNDLVLPTKFYATKQIWKQINCSSLNVQTERAHRRRNRFACRVANKWNCLPLKVTSVTEQREFKKTNTFTFQPIQSTIKNKFTIKRIESKNGVAKGGNFGSVFVKK